MKRLLSLRLTVTLLLCALPALSRAATLLGLVDTGELFASTDNGESWSVRSTLPVRDAVGLSARSSTSELFLASASGTVYRSVNGGIDWNAVGAVPVSDVVDILVGPDLSVLLLASSGSIFRSTNQGSTFTGIAALTGSNFASLTFTLPTVKFYAVTRTGEVWESSDNGSSWLVKGVITLSDAIEIRAVGTTLYVMSSTGDVYRSTNQSVSWSAVGTLSQSGMTTLARDDMTLYASSRGGEVASSPDGITWTWKGAINQLKVTALSTDSPPVSSITDPPAGSVLSLRQPWPNPARSTDSMHLSFRLPGDAEVTLDLYDASGRFVAGRPAEVFAAGSNTVTWKPHLERAGIYFVRLSLPDNESVERRWVVLR